MTRPEETTEVYEYLVSAVGYEELVAYVEGYFQMFGGLGLMLFAGCFIGITLIMANGCILYFRQLMEAFGARARYRLAAHLGFKQSEIVRAVRRQLSLVFSLPFVVGLFHALLALTLLKRLTHVEIWEAHAIVVAGYFVLYTGFFLLNRRAYVRTAGID